MEMKSCIACGRMFRPRHQTPDQQYCSLPQCQRERRRRWQQKKRYDDPDYRDNEKRSRKRWATEHPDYWKRYRADNPDYVDHNRNLQQTRNQKHCMAAIANEDLSRLPPPLPSGRYRLIHLGQDEIANGDAWIVEITVLSEG